MINTPPAETKACDAVLADQTDIAELQHTLFDIRDENSRKRPGNFFWGKKKDFFRFFPNFFFFLHLEKLKFCSKILLNFYNRNFFYI